MDRLLTWLAVGTPIPDDEGRPATKRVLRRLIRLGFFPQPVQLGEHSLRFRESEVAKAIRKLEHGKGVWTVRKTAPAVNVSPAGQSHFPAKR
jgi:hypothetical protein